MTAYAPETPCSKCGLVNGFTSCPPGYGGTFGVVLACLAAACGADDAIQRVMPEVDTIGGVVVVRNGTGLWRESEQWRVVEEFRVGSDWGENPDEGLVRSRNTSVSLGPNGRIFVLEYSTDRVVVFSRDGEFVQSYGGPGEGPGELLGPMAMAWDGTDRLWVGDRRGRYHVFDSTGMILKTVPRILWSVRRIQLPLVWEAGGTLVEEAGDEGVVLFLRVDTLGHLVDTMAVIPAPETSKGFRGQRFRPSWESLRFVLGYYGPDLRWSLAPDGTIWSAETGRLRLVQMAPGGDTLRVVETSHRAAEFDRRDLAMIEKGLKEAGISREDVELVRPVVHGIHVMDDGHILVAIVEEVGEIPSTFDVFDPRGFFLGTIDLGFGISRRNLPALVGDTIIAVVPGALDVPYLVRATIRRAR